MLNPEIQPLAVIHRVPHEPWQQTKFMASEGNGGESYGDCKGKLKMGLLEYSQGPYRSRFFLVPKKNPVEFRLINHIQPLNRVTICGPGMSLPTDEFLALGDVLFSAIDYYSSYNRILLELHSRDLMAFATLLGSLRQTRLPQGWMNLVAYFMQIITKVLWFLIPHYIRPFIDDVGIKGLFSRYNDEEISPRVRQFVWEHAQIFQAFMCTTWCLGMMISGAKSCVGMPEITIVGMVCDSEGRHSEQKKVQKTVLADATQCQGSKRICRYRGVLQDLYCEFSVIAALSSSCSAKMLDSNGRRTVNMPWIS